MAHVPPFHSVDPTDVDVYHDRDDCLRGRQILERHRRPGTNEYRRCFRCAEMSGRRIAAAASAPPPPQFPEIYLHP